MPRKKESPLKRASGLDRALLRSLTDPRTLTRGEAYYHEGRILSMTEWEGVVHARVEGTESYSVKLWEEGGLLQASCSCPVVVMGGSGSFCKHCIAVALALIEGEMGPGEPLPPAPAFSLVDVKDYLDESEKGVLVRFLLERVVEDEDLRDRLSARMRRRARSRAGTGKRSEVRAPASRRSGESAALE
jgi:uncharacterized Zn finger protein